MITIIALIFTICFFNISWFLAYFTSFKGNICVYLYVNILCILASYFKILRTLIPISNYNSIIGEVNSSLYIILLNIFKIYIIYLILRVVYNYYEKVSMDVVLFLW